MVATPPGGPPPASTYSGDPTTSPVDEVRFLVGDTDPNAWLMTDGEVAYTLRQAGGDPHAAAIRACEGILAKLARCRDETVGSVSISFSQDVAGYQARLATLRRALVAGAVPYAGGISRSDKLAQRCDGDRVKPSFIRDMQPYPDDPEGNFAGEGDLDGPRGAWRP